MLVGTQTYAKTEKQINEINQVHEILRLANKVTFNQVHANNDL